MSSVWSVQNAKSRFSELLDTSIHSTPQIISKRGQEVAVLVSIEEWQRLKAQAKPSLKELLLSDMARTDELVLPRRQDNQQTKRRDIPKFD